MKKVAKQIAWMHWPAVLRNTLLLCSTAALAGCSGSARPIVPPAEVPKEPPQKHPMEMIGKVNGRGWYLPWYARDPKNPKGPLMPVLIAEAQTGEVTNHNDSPQVVMRDVHAQLFQKGVHAANVDAAKIRADQENNTVVGSGGCTVRSLVNPSDTVLTAEKITWDSDNTRFVAEGNARVVRRPRDGGVPITQEGGKIVYDLEHNTITVL